MSSLFDPELSDRLARLGDVSRAAYRSARPFPHIVIDDFLPVEPVEQAVAAFPAPDDLDWQQFRNADEKKLAWTPGSPALPTSPGARSLAIYYYSNGRPIEEQSDAHSTLFQERPNGSIMQRSSRTVRRLAAAVMPPIVTNALRRRTKSGRNRGGR